ncbi:Mannose-1-phosphate guanylyltransferase (GDP) [Olavius algarvensis spirochete endosymbiont]|uniref:mannose-1-phosphate guanylyltransferase n=1 Tax=Olavius algarvensis spirochete endosymbiont TaxID=260710 RepID=UPI00052BDEBB|nr:sugar phosphate nucleotidyltransferase [Olavius algarvensis spirochete endosymbiont]KGM38882.1 hypothetical protein JY97_14150 [Alkalispirochaeta odontotermitis]VDB01088.1 Mannose-1-phosphate guanylyltransferase (GDP) [Olavius algarvensis spirochete endosymbiont]
MVKNVIIMAGGSGKRLWPASLGNKPKQFLKVDGKISLFQGALKLASHLGVSGCVYVVTHQSHVGIVIKECRNLSADLRSRLAILAEPIARNTAPALALAASRMLLDGRNEQTCLVMAADHIVSPFDEFSNSVEIASIEAEKGYIVLYGIAPLVPATGYGYIEIATPPNGASAKTFHSPRLDFPGTTSSPCYKVKTFHEKPDVKIAKEYLSSGCHYWNAGIFTYGNDVFFRELDLHAREISKLFDQPNETWFKKRNSEGIVIYEAAEELQSLYTLCPNISIDYAIMEKTAKSRMVRASFEWNDVGGWDAIAEMDTLPEAVVYSHQSSNNFVYSELPVALCGVEDLIVVTVNNRVLVCKKGMSELVREAASEDSKKE